MNSEEMLSDPGFCQCPPASCFVDDVGPHWDAVTLSVGEDSFTIWLLREDVWERNSDSQERLTRAFERISMVGAMMGEGTP